MSVTQAECPLPGCACSWSDDACLGRRYSCSLHLGGGAAAPGGLQWVDGAASLQMLAMSPPDLATHAWPSRGVYATSLCVASVEGSDMLMPASTLHAMHALPCWCAGSLLCILTPWLLAFAGWLPACKDHCQACQLALRGLACRSHRQ